MILKYNCYNLSNAMILFIHQYFNRAYWKEKQINKPIKVKHQIKSLSIRPAILSINRKYQLEVYLIQGIRFRSENKAYKIQQVMRSI